MTRTLISTYRLIIASLCVALLAVSGAYCWERHESARELLAVQTAADEEITRLKSETDGTRERARYADSVIEVLPRMNPCGFGGPPTPQEKAQEWRSTLDRILAERNALRQENETLRSRLARATPKR